MKNLSRFICLFLFGLFSLCAFGGPGLRNIDMSERGPNGLPLGWYYIGGADVIRCENGEVSLYERTSSTAIALIPFTGLKGGVSYEFQCEFQADENTECWIYVESHSSPDGEWNPPVGEKLRASGDWQRQVILFMPPEGTVESRVVLRLMSAGKAVFRNLQVQECVANHGIRNAESVPEKVTLYNGNFEDGQRVWKFGPNSSVVRSYDDFGNESFRLKKKGLVYQSDIRFRKNRLHKLVWFTKGQTKKLQEVTVEVLLSNGLSFRKQSKALPGEWSRDELSFLTPDGQEEVFSGQVSFQAGDDADMLVDEVFLREVEYEETLPVQAWVTSPANGSRIFSSMPVTEIRGGFRSNADVSAVTVSLLSGRKELKSILLPAQGEFAFPAKGLSVGRYLLEFAPVDRQGRALPKSILPIDKLPPAKYEVTFDGNLTLCRNGKPFVPFMPLSAYAPPKDRLSAYVFARSGVNSMVHEDMPLTRSLDLLASMGLVRLVQVANLVSLSKEDWQKPPEVFQPMFTAALEKALTPDIINHPAVLGYDHFDEAMAVDIPLVNFNYASRELRRLDPYHPIFYNEAPRGVTKEYVAAYARDTDVLGTDLYPVVPEMLHSSFRDKTLTGTGTYVEHLRGVMEYRKPVYIWLQAFSWAEFCHGGPGRLPNLVENRFTNFDAMMHGASALLYYNDSNYNNEYYRDVLLPSIREISSMGGVFRTGTEIPGVQAEEPILAKLFGYQGEKYLVAINRSGNALDAEVSGIQEDGTWNRLDEPGNIMLKNGAFRDHFPAYGVHVYSTASSYPEPLSPIPQVNPAFEARMDEDFFAPYMSSAPEFEGASWIWFPGEENMDNSQVMLRRTINVTKPLKKAVFCAAVDNSYQAFLNGEKIAECSEWNAVYPANVTTKLKKGKNSLLVTARNQDGPAGALISITLEYQDGTTERILSNAKWESENAAGRTASALEIVPAGLPPWRWNLDIRE